MAKLTICAAFLLAAVGGSYAADAWAADDMPTKAPSATTPSTAAPRPCADPSDFITTNCQLTCQGDHSCAAALTCTATNGIGAAYCNAANTTQFVDASVTRNGSSTYDDVLAYADRNTLVSMFGNGSCQTVW